MPTDASSNDGSIDAFEIDAAIPAGMVLVSAGPFMMGCNAALEGGAICNDAAQADELPQHQVQLDSFLIDRTEVSRIQYSECVAAQVCVPTGGDSTSNLPVAVTWAQAATYCNWAAKRLATEAEWEKAARGSDGRTFPWGSTSPNCTLAHYADCGGGYVPIDSLPSSASPYGALNMAGNISEWVRDYYDPTYYVGSPSTNPEGPATGDSKVLRGGNGISPVGELRVANRSSRLLTANSLFGIRCAQEY